MTPTARIPRSNTPKLTASSHNGLGYGFRVLRFLFPLNACVVLPLATMGGCPLGLSLIGPSGCDRGLLDWVAETVP